MIHNQIDYLIYREVDRYFASDGKQKEFAKQRYNSIDTINDWIKIIDDPKRKTAWPSIKIPLSLFLSW